MKLFFVHDHPFYRENEDVYSGGGLPARVWDNYLAFFSEVKIFGRLSKHVKDRNILSSGDTRLTFKLTENYSSPKNFFINFRKLRKEIKKEIIEADLVLIRLPSLLGFVTGFIALKLNKKILVEQVGNANEAMNTYGSILAKFSAVFFELTNKYLVKKANYISYVTSKKLQNDYPTQALSVELSNVIITTISPKKDYKQFENLDFKIALIGGFDVKFKGQDVLLKAIQLLSPSIKNNISVYFIGKGNYSWLINFAQKLNLEQNIKFIGSKESGKPIFDLLSQMNLYVQPSLTEGMPRSTIEAMSVGCPVIGSRVGGIPDIVNPLFLHDPGDFKALSLQILKLYEDRELLLIESQDSIVKSEPYLKVNIDKRRTVFYEKIINDLKNA